MKKCGKCKVEKNESEFNKDKSKKDGLENRCKSCKKEGNKLRKIRQMFEGKCCHCGKNKEDKTQYRCNECKEKLRISTISYKSKIENRQKISNTLTFLELMKNSLKNQKMGYSIIDQSHYNSIDNTIGINYDG
jgi:hypothetical protein